MFLEDLLILLAFVWVCRKIFEVFRLPALFGEIFAGVLAGPVILGLVHETEAMKVLAELGVFFLMFHSGLESEPEDLAKDFKTAVLGTVSNLALATAGSFLIGWMFNLDPRISIFLALNLSITAVTIAARVFKDTKLSKSRVANTVMASAVMTEVVVLAAFSVFLDLGKPGAVFELNTLLINLLKFAGYFVGVFFVGHYCFRYLQKLLYKGNKGFTFSIILALVLAEAAELIGLHFIIGAFLTGLFLHKELFQESAFSKIEDRTFGISYGFLAPVFFASLAFHIDFSAAATAPLFLIAVLVIMMATKLLGSGLVARMQGMSKVEALGVGLGMNSRGAVDLIIASIALHKGMISVEIFSVLVLVSFIATLICILGLKPVAKRLKEA